MKITRLFLQALLQVIIHLAAVLAGSNSYLLNKDDTAEGEWGTWSAWSSCSVKCATGISARTRECQLPQSLPIHTLIDSAHKRLLCDGDSKQIKICNTHECQSSHDNRRDSKCSKFNARVFNGKKYAWESYINPRKRCELTCKAKGQHFYARLSNRAVDGTVCSLTTLAVCVKGQCKDVGCDGIVGSNVTRDKCGICMGDGTTCRTITGIFTRPELSPGYTKIITIPAGSTNINITELRHSKNYLALRTNHDMLLNGNNKVFLSGSYKMLGSTLVYKRRTRMCRTQCANIDGPTNDTTDLMVFGFSRNSGILYSFNVPTNVTNTYFKNLIARDEQQNEHEEDKHQSHETKYLTQSRNRTTLITSHRARLASIVNPTPKPEIVMNDAQANDRPAVNRRAYSQYGNSVSQGNAQSDVGAVGESQGYSVVLRANTGPDGEIQPIFPIDLDSTESDSNELDSTESDSNELDSIDSDSNVLDSIESDLNDLDSTKSDSNELNSTESDSNDLDSTESDSVSEETSEVDNIEILNNDPSLKPITNTEAGLYIPEKDDDEIKPITKTEDGDELDDFIAISLDDTQRNEEDEANINKQEAGDSKEHSPSEDTFSDTFQQDSNINPKEPQSVIIPGNNINNKKLQPLRIPDSTINAEPQPLTIRDSNTNNRRSQGVMIPHHNVNKKRPHSVRIPTYSQRFTFRDRYRALINAKMKQRNRNLLARLQHKTHVPTSGVAGRSNGGHIVSLSGNSGTGRVVQAQRHHRHRNFNDMRNLAMNSIKSESKLALLNPHASNVNNITQEAQPVTVLNPVTTAAPIVSSSESTKALDDNNQGDIILQTHQTNSDSDSRDFPRRPVIHRQPILSPPIVNSRVAEDDQTLALEDAPRGSESRVLTRNIPHPSGSNGNLYDKNTIEQSSGRHIIPRQHFTHPTSGLESGLHGSREDNPGLRSEPSQRVPPHYGSQGRTAELTIGRTHVRLDASEDTSSSNSIRSTYTWRVSGFSECTTTCGGGVQQTTVVCVDSRSQAVVTDENCVYLTRPAPQAVTCSTRPCPAKWTVSAWSSCSVTCGEGVETRTVVCRSRVSRTLNITMSDESCPGEEKPDSRRACQKETCFSWNVEEFSVCNVSCGEGVRRRAVTCVDHDQEEVNEEHCAPDKPSTQELCDMGSCGHGWYHTMWPHECPADCGEGVQNRRLYCAGQRGEALPLSRCDTLDKPETERTCRMETPCGGAWFTGEWTRCNATCGSAYKTRHVVCVKQLPGSILAVVEEENCKGTQKPESGSLCDLPPCQPEWYMTSWKKCSKSCGTGFRTREVKCLDPDQHPSAACPSKDKPRTRETCNTQECRLKPTPTSQTRSAKCKDSFSQCVLVKKARLCRFNYYAKMCCHSCSNET